MQSNVCECISLGHFSFTSLILVPALSKTSSPMKMSYQRGPTGVMGAINNHTPFANAPPPIYNSDSAASLGNGQMSGLGRINSPEAASTTSTTFPASRLTLSGVRESDSESDSFPTHI
jgi:hypothetical protein